MASQWFKFYGQEFLSDPKMLSLTPLERSLWLTMLCLASSAEKEGIIRYISEEKIKTLTGVSVMDDGWKETEGFLKSFEKLGMITIDNETIVINNWDKRQQRAMTSYERLKKYRVEHRQISNKNEANDNEMITDDNDNDNARIDKNRIDKNRIDDIYEVNIRRDKSMREEKHLSANADRNFKKVLDEENIPF